MGKRDNRVHVKVPGPGIEYEPWLQELTPPQQPEPLQSDS